MRKKYAKLMMLVLAMVLAVQVFTGTVYAIDRTEKGTITVEGVEKGVSVHVYKLTDVNYDFQADQPVNPMHVWKTELAEWMEENFPSLVEKDNENAVSKIFLYGTEENYVQFYEGLAAEIKGGNIPLVPQTVEAEGDMLALDSLDMGTYFLLIEGGAKVYRPLVANVVPEWTEEGWKMTNPTVVAKSSEPVIEKIISGGSDKFHAGVGDTVSFELRATIPSYPANAVEKKYVVSDKLSEGLTLVSDSIKVYGMDGNEEGQLLTAGYTISKERPAQQEEVSFALNFDFDVIQEYQSLKVTYDTILNEKAVVGGGGNYNQAILDFTNNPYEEGSWGTDKANTTTFTYGLEIAKINGDLKSFLSGAEFSLMKDGKEIRFTGTKGSYYVSETQETGETVVEVDERGILMLHGLDAGIYSLTEVKAPDGYMKLQHPIEIEIVDQDLDGLVETGDRESDSGYLFVSVSNNKGFVLPVTGGTGTTMFGIVGAAFMLGGLLLIMICCAKKKRG